jgi:hypothetical protein
MTLYLICQYGAAATGLISALLWARAATVEVKQGDPRSTGSTFIEGIDVSSTLREQGRWNRHGAIATAIAMLLQAAAIWLTPPN